MGMVENQWRFSLSRRRALASFAGLFAASPLLRAQIDPHSLIGHKRIPRIDELVDAFDFEALCYRNMTLEPYDYMAHGDGSEWNLRRNRQVFDWVDIVQGKAVDPASVDMSSVILGVPMKFPIFTAPSSGQGALHPDGEIGMYRGATAANALAAFASGTTVPHQKIAASCDGPAMESVLSDPRPGRVGQAAADIPGSGRKGDHHHRRSAGVGLRARPARPSSRRRGPDGGGGRGGRGGGGGNAAAAAAQAALESGAPIPTTGTGEPGIGKFPSFTKYRVSNRRLWYSWDYVDEVRKVIKVPVILKGIVTAEDAEICVKEGVDGIIVSNHGGRSMDYGPSTLEVLPEIVAVVNKRFPVMIDSGFRRGSDVFKALALGADAVALGRAARWGLGAYGAPGVQRLLEVLQAELVHAAAYAGRATLKSIDKTAVKTNFV